MRILYSHVLGLRYLFPLAGEPLGEAPGQPVPECRVGSAAGAAEKLISGWRSGDSSEGKGLCFVFCVWFHVFVCLFDCFFSLPLEQLELSSVQALVTLRQDRRGLAALPDRQRVLVPAAAAQSGVLLSVLSRLVWSSR